PARWSREAAQAPAHAELLQSIQRERTLALPGFVAPRTIDELADALEAAPDSLLLAGGTDVGLWVTKHLRELPPIVYLGEVAELQTIEIGASHLRIGAAVPLTDAWREIVARIPALAEVAERFGSPPVRNSGTHRAWRPYRTAPRRGYARARTRGFLSRLSEDGARSGRVRRRRARAR